MKTSLITPIACSLALSFGNAQVLNQWNFDDTSGTDLGSAVDSIGSATFSGNLGGGGTFDTDGSGFLTGLGRLGNADIADVTTGVYQFDLTGVTFSSMSGGTDDSLFFGLRSGSSATNSGFVSGSGTFDQAVIVVGNENDGGGVDYQIWDNGADRGSGSDLAGSSDFSGTWDFRIELDFDNDTADYFYQLNGGGYNTIVSQQFNAASPISHLAIGSNGFGATISIDQATWSAVPEPSAYGLICGMLALGFVANRRRR